jgi:hypothetical protein
MNQFPNNFQKVVNFLKTQSISVELSNSTCYIGNSDNAKIYIHRRYNLNKNGLYALLHEAGHFLQPHGKYSANHYKNVDDCEQPTKFNMYQFMNEVDAWDRGLNLANELGIFINKEEWGKEREIALLTYYV